MSSRINAKRGLAKQNDWKEEDPTDDEEEEEPMCPWIHNPNFLVYLVCGITTLLVIVGLIAGIYFVVESEKKFAPATPIVGGKVESTTKKPETNSNDGEPEPPTTTTIEPTCYPRQKYEWLVDLDLPDSSPYKSISLFSGNVTYWRMLSICNRIDIESRNKNASDESYGALYLTNKKMEDKIDDIIYNDYSDQIFGSSLPNEKKLLWTGWAYEYRPKHYDWVVINGQQNPEATNRNFCNKLNWIEGLDKRQYEQKGVIYVVKNYGRWSDAGCWEFYTAKELLEIMGQPANTIPRLFFACPSVRSKKEIDGNTKKYSGKTAMPGEFAPMEDIAGGRPYDVNKRHFKLYGVSATFDDALDHCKKVSHEHRLPTVNNDLSLQFIQNALIESAKNVKPKTDYDRLWTGGVYDASLPDYNNNIEWRVPPSGAHRTNLFKSNYEATIFPTFDACDALERWRQ